MNRERWQDFNQVWHAHLEAGARIADRWHKSADALSHMMISTAFVLNAGGIISIPALHQFLNGPGTALLWERWAGILFLIGIVAAGISGIGTIWNYRMLALNTEATHEVSAREIEEKWHAEGTFTPSEELQLLQRTPLVGSKSIPLTFVVGWSFGVLSYVAFLAGALIIAFCGGA
jgi:hypothetical protein